MEDMKRRGLAVELIQLSEALSSQSKAIRKNSRLSEARLSIIHFLVDHGPQTLKSLAEYRKVSAATMSRLVAALVEEGWVLKANSRQDKRSKIFIVTRKGKSVANNEKEQELATLAKALEQLTPEEQETLNRGMGLIETVISRLAKIPV